MTNPNEPSHSKDLSNLQTSNMAMSVPNPFLRQTEPASIRAFFRQYDQYCRTVIAHAKKLHHADGPSTTTTEAVLPMQLKYYVDAQHFTSCIALDFIDDVTSFGDMTGEQLRAYLNSEEEESKEAVTLEILDELIEKKLGMNMDNKNNKSRMQGLFADYRSILVEQGVKWIIEENQKLAVTRPLHAVRPQSLKERL